MSNRTAIVIGASSGLGRAIADEMAGQGWDLVIGSRSQDDLDVVAAELVAAHAVAVTPVAVDVAAGHDHLQSFLDAAAVAAPNPDAVIITVGTVTDVDEGTTDWATTEHLLAVNMSGVMLLAGHYADVFEQRNAGTLVLFSSIAAGAPRRKNVAYAAAKAGLESFAGSMQHRFGTSPVAVQLYRLGYVDTRLAAGQKLLLKPADPREVAQRVVAELGGRSRTVFEPRYWGAIVRGLQALPAPLYNRVDF